MYTIIIKLYNNTRYVLLVLYVRAVSAMNTADEDHVNASSIFIYPTAVFTTYSFK